MLCSPFVCLKYHIQCTLSIRDKLLNVHQNLYLWMNFVWITAKYGKRKWGEKKLQASSCNVIEKNNKNYMHYWKKCTSFDLKHFEIAAVIFYVQSMDIFYGKSEVASFLSWI